MHTKAVDEIANRLEARLVELELYVSERARERRHVRRVPGLEREEIRTMYMAKGFAGELLDRIVETITSNEDVRVDAMMSEEHKLAPFHHAEALRGAAIVGLAALVGSLVPLVPFLFASGAFAQVVSRARRVNPPAPARSLGR